MDSRDQESIQLSITFDKGHHEKVTKHTRKHHSQESREVSPYPAADHKGCKEHQDSITKANVKQITQKHFPGMVSKITFIFSELDNLF